MKTIKRLSLICTVLILVLISIVATVSADAYPESSHNYTDNMDRTWTYFYEDPSVDFLRVTFSSYTEVEYNYDKIYLYTINGDLVGIYTGTDLAGVTVEIPGNGFSIRLTSDGSITRYGFKIDQIAGHSPIQISECEITWSNLILTYNGTEQTPVPTVMYDSQILEENVDYTLTYYNNKNVGTATVEITGIGEFAGTVTENFTIAELDLSDASITLSSESLMYNGAERIPTITVSYDSQTLKMDEDYTLVWYDNINVGTATVEIIGMGSCTGTVTKTFTIEKLSLPQATITLSSTSLIYNGLERTPTPTVKYDSKTLKKDVDYKVTYSNNKDVGTAVVTITGIGSCTETVTKTFTINKIPLSNASVQLSSTSLTYNGLARTPTPTVKYNSQTLRKDVDYKVTYSNNKNAGTATVKITGIGVCTGTTTKTFTIMKLPLSNTTIKLSSTTLTYNGATRTPTPTVKFGTQKLKKDVDYTVSYSNNKKAGTATVKITGKGSCTGTVTKTFTIKKMPLSTASIKLSSTTLTYNGATRTPTVTVKSGAQTLKKDVDYTVSYSNNKKAGTATVKITGKGSCTGTVTKTFTIKKLSMSKSSVKLSSTSLIYNGATRKPTPTVKYDSKTLKKDVDYTVSYSNNKNAGTATVKITGKGSCTGTITKTFTIKKLPLSSVSVSKIKDQTYTGKAIKPKITVKSGNYTISSSNYKVTYSSNTNAGTATVTITATGSNTSGSKKVTFKILPTLSNTSKNMYVGKTFTLKLNGVSASKVTFSSSKTSVCKVSSKGVVSGVSAGSATIYAKYNGVTYSCAVTVLASNSSSSTTKYYQNHDDVPDFGALVKIEPTSSYNGDEFVYSISDLQDVDPDKEAGDKYRNLLVDCGFTLKSSSTVIDGKYYYKYVSEKKIVYFGIASKNNEVRIIVELA